MKQFIIMATVVAFSACNNNNSTNNIPRNYIPNYGECVCSSELRDNSYEVIAHKAIANGIEDTLDESAIAVPAYGFESYTGNIPGRANRLPFNYDDYISEVKLGNRSAGCLIDSVVAHAITIRDYIEMIKSFMNNGYINIEQVGFYNSTFSLSGNELEITSTHSQSGEIQRVIVDLAGHYQFINLNQVRGENVCLHKQYDFELKFTARYIIERNGVETEQTNRPIFIIKGRPDTTHFENEILHKTILTQEEFRKRLFKKASIILSYPNTNGYSPNFLLDSRIWQD
jgi:hypothetical protein